jgi:hypothetical protein
MSHDESGESSILFLPKIGPKKAWMAVSTTAMAGEVRRSKLGGVIQGFE